MFQLNERIAGVFKKVKEEISVVREEINEISAVEKKWVKMASGPGAFEITTSGNCMKIKPPTNNEMIT